MSAGAQYDIVIKQGKTFSLPVTWEADPLVYAPIASITKADPAVVTTQNAHGLRDGQMVAFLDVLGMTEINAQTQRDGTPRDTEFQPLTYISPTSFSMNRTPAASFGAHVANSGYVVSRTAVNLTGYTARMQIRQSVAATSTLLDLVSGTPGAGQIQAIALDNTTKTITVTLDETTTASLTWTKGVYDLELENNGVVHELLTGVVTVQKEVTR